MRILIVLIKKRKNGNRLMKQLNFKYNNVVMNYKNSLQRCHIHLCLDDKNCVYVSEMNVE